MLLGFVSYIFGPWRQSTSRQEQNGYPVSYQRRQACDSCTFPGSLSLREECGVSLPVPASPEETEADPEPKTQKVNQSLAVQPRNYKEKWPYCFCSEQFFKSHILSGSTLLLLLFYFSHNLSLMSFLLTSCLVTTELHSSPPFAAQEPCK